MASNRRAITPPPRSALSLSRVLTPPDTTAPVVAATIASVSSDGTVIVDFGGGRKSGACRVLSAYTPTFGDVVEVMRRDAGSWLVLGSVRSSNTTTQNGALIVRTPYNVLPSVGGVSNPLTVSVSATGSWRQADGWGSSYMPTTDAVAQGAYSPISTYYYGCYFYGSGAFASLAGRRCTSLTIRVHRLGSGGTSAATQQVIGPHVHPTQPGGAPSFPWGAQNVGSLAWNATSTLTLPSSWGDLLISGQAAGLGHLLLAWGNGNQSYAAGKAADSLTGQLSIGWA